MLALLVGCGARHANELVTFPDARRLLAVPLMEQGDVAGTAFITERYRRGGVAFLESLPVSDAVLLHGGSCAEPTADRGLLPAPYGSVGGLGELVDKSFAVVLVTRDGDVLCGDHAGGSSLVADRTTKAGRWPTSKRRGRTIVLTFATSDGKRVSRQEPIGTVRDAGYGVVVVMIPSGWNGSSPAAAELRRGTCTHLEAGPVYPLVPGNGDVADAPGGPSYTRLAVPFSNFARGGWVVEGDGGWPCAQF